MTPIDKTEDPNGFEIQDDGTVTSSSPSKKTEDGELESKMLNLFRRMSVCAARHQDDDSEWIDGQCVTPSTAAKEAIKLTQKYATTKAEQLAAERLQKHAKRLLTIKELRDITRDDLREHYIELAADIEWDAYKSTLTKQPNTIEE